MPIIICLDQNLKQIQFDFCRESDHLSITNVYVGVFHLLYKRKVYYLNTSKCQEKNDIFSK